MGSVQHERRPARAQERKRHTDGEQRGGSRHPQNQRPIDSRIDVVLPGCFTMDLLDGVHLSIYPKPGSVMPKRICSAFTIME